MSLKLGKKSEQAKNNFSWTFKKY